MRGPPHAFAAIEKARTPKRVTPPCELWAALSDDVVERIVHYALCGMYNNLECGNPAMRQMVYTMRLVHPRFEDALHPIVLLLSPPVKFTFPSRFVEGVLLLIQELVAGRVAIAMDVHSSLHITVHEACTTRTREQSHYLYEALRASLSDYGVEGARYYQPEGPKRDQFKRFVSHLFAYLNRYHVLRFDLPPVEDLFVCP